VKRPFEPAEPTRVAEPEVQRAGETASPRPALSPPGPLHDPCFCFLSAQGVPPQGLLEGARRAEEERVPLSRAVLAAGIIAEDSLYRYLARHLGLRFVEEPVEVVVPEIEGALEAGLVPFGPSTQDRCWLIAPAPERIPELLTGRRLRAPAGRRLFVTSPMRYRRLVCKAAADRLADRASADLLRFEPAMSARSFSRTPALIFAGVIAAFGLAACAPGPWWLACSALLATAIAVKLHATIASARPQAPPGPRLADAGLPVYSVLVPLYREERVLPSLLAALAALDYPRSKLDVKFVIESDDAGMRAALARARVPPWIEIVVAPPGSPRTKPRALNVALLLARGSLVCVYDAEDEPDPRQLRDAAERFAVEPPELACLQASLAIDNMADSTLTAFFGLEYAALFDVQMRGLSALGLPLPLGGTSNHFRIEALRRVRAWDAWNVTEDMDLGLRLARFGFSVKTMPSTTYEEAPARIGAWVKQRRRWMKGGMQSLLTHCSQPRRALRELGPMGALAALSLIAGPLVGYLIAPLLALRLGLYVATGWPAPGSASELAQSVVALFILICGAIALIWPITLGMRRRGLFAFWPALAMLPFYLALLSWSAWRALYDLLRDPYHWAKTEHGLARTSRRRRARPR